MHNVPKNPVTKFAHAQMSFAPFVDKKARFRDFVTILILHEFDRARIKTALFHSKPSAIG
jgi:hypothetical protein